MVCHSVMALFTACSAWPSRVSRLVIPRICSSKAARLSVSCAASGWHFLTGEQSQITKLAQTVGFHYAWDDHTNTWAHASGIIVLTPSGKVSRYFYGIEFSPRDLRLGLIEAAADRIGSPIDQLLLFCYHYDPSTGKYGLLITNIIQLASIATALALGSYVFVTLRWESKQKSKSQKPV